MELSHRFTVPASVDVAWEAFNDLERVAPCFPGASLTSYDGETFQGICKVKLGPVSLQYGGTGRFLERDESAYRAVIEAKGKDKRGNGTAAATITAQLASAGDDATDVIVSTDLNITGRPAQFGRGVMQDVSDKLLAQFTSCLEAELAEQVGQTAGDERSAAQSGAAQSGADETGIDETGVETLPFPDKATAESSELNLAATVLPALLKRYAPYAAASVASLWLLRKLRRR
jgi:carbon monoxide dehydrogenase subunit G